MTECDEHWKIAGRVHMLGICGVGMAGVAYLLSKRGWQVTGCDTQLNSLAPWLTDAGIMVTQGHDIEHLTLIERVIMTPAVAATNPELSRAKASKIPVYRRGEVLANLCSEAAGVAICGTHGKTTTACFTTRLLQVLGAAPQWCIGGMTPHLGAVAGVAEGEWLVAEADESDGTLARYHPQVMVLTNIDLDHLEHFHGEEDLLACFQQAVQQTRKGVAVCCDDARAWQIAEKSKVPMVSFGFAETAMLRAYELHDEAASISFEISYAGRAWGHFKLGVSGKHNVLNALGAAAAVLICGVATPEQVFQALGAACDELPLRRFETIAEIAGIRFVIDYAHHPAELKAAITMACRQQHARLIVIFQPHRYTRTRMLGPTFPPAFEGADEVILLPVYAASESPIVGGDSADLYEHFRKKPHGGQKLMLARSLNEVWGYLEQTLKAGDLVLIAGAGDVINLAEKIWEAQAHGWPHLSNILSFESVLKLIDGLSILPSCELKEWSVLRVGGQARWRVEVMSESALAAFLSACQQFKISWRMVGSGTNTWFSDLGEAGCVLRFARMAFKDIKIADKQVEVGCGVVGAKLLDVLEQAGLAGLEFLEGVPGQVGGWIAMNAGAHGEEIGAYVEWIRCLNSAGEIVMIKSFECGFKYRHCEGVQGCVVLACGLRLKLLAPAAIKNRRQQLQARRVALTGLCTAGSVFKNPVGKSAGALLDAVGCKGWRVGGASVVQAHANIIAVDEQATASDVLALTLQMQNQVKRSFDVSLQTEISGL